MKKRIFSLLLCLVMMCTLVPVAAFAEEPLTEEVLTNGVNKITASAENKLYNVDDGKALAITGTKENPITFTNCTFALSGKTMYINGTGVGYNGETITKLGIGEYVTFENCTFTATDGGRSSSSGNDACIQFFGPGIVVNGGSVTGTDWQGQFMGLYGSANVTFDGTAIQTTGNTGGWSYAMYGQSVLTLNDSSMTATGMKRAAGGGNVNAFYSGDARTGYDAIFVNNSTIDFRDNAGGGFAINNVNIHVTSDSHIIVCNNAGNACNSGYWFVDDSTIIMNGNRGHAMSLIGFEMEDSTVEILHNGYAGLYIQSKDSSFTNCDVDIRCNGEKLLSYSAGDVWLNGHILTLTDCENAWLGAVGRKGTVVTENSTIIAADLNDLGQDLTSGLLKSKTAPVLADATLAENFSTDSHVLFINSNVVSKDDKTVVSPYPRGNTEGQSVQSNDADLWEDADVHKDVITAKGSPYIASFTSAQLAHHKYDWSAGEVKEAATPEKYGILAFPCTDVCADYTNNTEEHPNSFDCAGTYVYAPLVGLAFDANIEAEVAGMPEDQLTLSYGDSVSAPETVPTCEGYRFVGWYADPEGTQPFDFDAALTENYTVAYAAWEKVTDITVVKEWKLDDGGKAADSVTITLLNNGQACATAELNKENDWTYTWTVPADGQYTVAEENVPDGFTASITFDQAANTYTVTNDDVPVPPVEAGDSTPVALWMTLLLVSGGALLCLFVFRSKMFGHNGK
ncbi:MAG: Cna B-type domain-containing protein [Candidatus Heritagella sp.]|nr:Cna B-type domain-containing protein [Candidatus Heritagella sp.]